MTALFKQAGDFALGVPAEMTKGIDALQQNIHEVQMLANSLKSTLGPFGLDKLMVYSDIDMVQTNDGWTILKDMDVQQAAKMVKKCSALQKEAVGDGSTSVVLIAAELLRTAGELVKKRIKPQVVISGYKLALELALGYLKENISFKPQKLDRETLLDVAENLGAPVLQGIAQTAMVGKAIGDDSDFWAPLAVDAVLAMQRTKDGKPEYPIEQINFVGTPGQGSRDSKLIYGFAFEGTVASRKGSMEVKNAKIALLDMNLQPERMKMGIELRPDKPDDLGMMRDEEKEMAIRRAKMVLDAGANVVLVSGSVHEVILDQFNGVMAVRRVKINQLKEIAHATGGKVVKTFADVNSNTADDKYEAADLGHAGSVYTDHMGDRDFIFIEGCKRKSASFVLRGSSDEHLAEMEKALKDSLNAVRRVLEEPTFVPGGGACEVALHTYLQEFATTVVSREQEAIAAFADALLVIPRTLAVNAAQDAYNLVMQLRSRHVLSQCVDAGEGNEDEKSVARKKAYRNYGLDLYRGKVVDMTKANVIEPTLSKVCQLKYAFEACQSILRVDAIIIQQPESQREDDGHGH